MQKDNQQSITVTVDDLNNLFAQMLAHTGQTTINIENLTFNVTMDEWELATLRAQRAQYALSQGSLYLEDEYSGNTCGACYRAVNPSSCVMHNGQLFHFECWGKR